MTGTASNSATMRLKSRRANPANLASPQTTATKEQGNSRLELQSSAAFSSATHSNQQALIDSNTAGKMLDSDGFEMARMEAEDYEDLSLEQKILCGFYAAKPFQKAAYPIDNLNMPKMDQA
mmetsp:Transcript_46022/g.60969  ORF Transcript_46022/g.60969 Transcript_46022/m.60969 type:complete len:121 (+) Transcript_46022:1053-1415(+)|eukprot:CAMPEP_0185598152 /NCGR_PEP_ID=MMETSP0434-20130131/81822_1 /TAXON_ID=626734 ORGANISM="Favella taraikaensis, Strain Fe Narragansett Bay" /NCGR_SAMPLE_ID=MMETSP0434 /ASSEMBLY_ACC=CAM_ASM_000379 /LENGTH=120 /DNA_ID=CAMNT_0028227073 /DNA_START=1515 /DNA_END=1877 /DNA_ORIENTATION=+